MSDETTREALEAASASKAMAERKNKKRLAGVAAGIGSAAIVAALLYTNRSRKNDKGGSSSK
jgi:hypothetical protein